MIEVVMALVDALIFAGAATLLAALLIAFFYVPGWWVTRR